VADPTKEEIMNKMKGVYDPEIPVNIVDLGLIYEANIEEGNVNVLMTLTSPGCSVGPHIAQQVEWAISELPGIENVNVEMTFDPPWNPEMISAEAKQELGID
jgi:metal-sulfur cluster biosynthetic enzyme